MSTDLRRRRSLRSALAVGAASVALLCAVAGPATAAESPGQKIADALRTSPVYVDPSLSSAVGPDDQRALVQKIRQSRLPIRVVLVPLVEGDNWGGKPEQLIEVVHERMGGGPAILIAPGHYPDDIEAREWPADAHQAERAAASVFFDDAMKGTGLTKRISRAIDLIEAGDGNAEYERRTAGLGTSGGASPKKPAAQGTSPVVRIVTLAVGPVLVLAAAWLLLRRRSRLRDFGTPFAMPRSVFAAAHRADEDGLRERAGEEVVRLGEEARAATGDPAAIERALDAYAAAGTVLDRARGVPDLAGVFALVAEGRAALSPTPATLPLCFFHPLHGPATRRIPWRPLGRREQLRVAACDACLRAVRTRRAPEVLTDRLDDRPVPYFEVPAEKSLWAATGYGSLLSGASLAARVQRGDFTRTLE
ncbi:hypothetical protein [Streptomyces noursei]|uniref:hypothetical protein n=1 Tax=Streptomyces noursei TaxID=1971 RepID=UPI001678000D|nr:hypothetical protein [Streptomyces noursei]MCZ1017520.1 hypothetical protein [Streptomyces noursei]GGX14863.1 hypothetical protein GCM10010341_40400 [Streptomyces noursei]